jgi:hypothetical protein
MKMYGVPSGIVQPPRAAVPPSTPAEEEASHKAPGTMVLVFVFLAAFVVYYFVNWKLLSELWKIR